MPLSWCLAIELIDEYLYPQAIEPDHIIPAVLQGFIEERLRLDVMSGPSEVDDPGVGHRPSTGKDGGTRDPAIVTDGARESAG